MSTVYECHDIYPWYEFEKLQLYLPGVNELTHWGEYKHRLSWPAVLLDNIYLRENICILIKFVDFLVKGVTDNRSALA